MDFHIGVHLKGVNNMSNFIVTGGKGFIGSHLVDKLTSKGHDVIVIDNESAQSNERFYVNDKATNMKVDINDYDEIEPMFYDIDAVFHLASEARLQPSIGNPLLTLRTNYQGTANVLEASRKHKVKRVIFSSTSSSYGLKNIPPLKEDMIPDCLTPYSASKIAAEELCKLYYHLYGLETVILRYFNVYGERHPLKGQYAPIIGRFLKQWMYHKPMTVVGDGSKRRDYTHVKDVINANILSLKRDTTNMCGEVFNVGTGKNYSSLEIAKMIQPDVPTAYRFIDDRPAESKETLADITKIRGILGWYPTVQLEDWIKKFKEIGDE